MTNGEPTGSNYGGSTPGTLAGPASNTFYTVTLGTNATAIKNEWVALVIEWDGVAGNLSIQMNEVARSRIAFPHARRFTTSWLAAVSDQIPFAATRYNDGTYEGNLCVPWQWNDAIITSATTPDEVANQFNFPFEVDCGGFWFDITSLADDIEVTLYRETTVARTLTIDEDMTRGGQTLHYSLWDGITLDANVNYYLALRPLTVTANNLRYRYGTFASSDVLVGSSPLGLGCVFASRTDTGAWSVNTSQRLFAGLIIPAGGDLIIEPVVPPVLPPLDPTPPVITDPNPNSTLPPTRTSPILPLDCPPFRLFQRDLEVRVKQWGSTEAYQVLRPLGGKHFTGGEDGGSGGADI